MIDTPTPSYNEELSRLAEIDRQSEVAVVKSLMASPGGRRYMWNMMSFCSVFSSHGAPESGQLYFNEGMRNVGLKLLYSIQANAPEAYESMVKESAAITAYLRSVKTAEDAQHESEFGQ